ncbi:hypothetical protein [Georgenia thermotolerans]|uniref:Uncharacterized protein n=1 Tax=Georgenia thermotolerans TaxID=527326 RepID=A0A7J5UMC4_9MICO|nr:hypothetical protein [Georgenia thermotolerans]KAE8763516.1 hypothetical protein GB883_13835 [Georgenia thermotolerans]
MPRSVLVHDLPDDVAETITAHGAHLTTRDTATGIDLVVTAGPVVAPPGIDILQIGGPVSGAAARPALEPVPPRQRWRPTLAAQLLRLDALLVANVLTDPPTVALRWPVPPPAADAVSLACTTAGHHAAAILRRSRGGHLWWVSDRTLDALPWVEHLLRRP